MIYSQSYYVCVYSLTKTAALIASSAVARWSSRWSIAKLDLWVYFYFSTRYPDQVRIWYHGLYPIPVVYFIPIFDARVMPGSTVVQLVLRIMFPGSSIRENYLSVVCGDCNNRVSLSTGFSCTTPCILFILIDDSRTGVKMIVALSYKYNWSAAIIRSVYSRLQCYH